PPVTCLFHEPFLSETDHFFILFVSQFWGSLQTLITNQFSILIRGSLVGSVNFFTPSGWLVQATADFLDQHHPVCAFKGGFAAFLDGGATPPHLRRGLFLGPKILLRKQQVASFLYKGRPHEQIIFAACLGGYLWVPA